MAIEFRKAHRRATPLLIGVSSVSGGGKTFSALLLAAGLAGPGGKVAMIDSENGRGELYSDSPGIVAAFRDHPGGMYEYARFDPPFSPERYAEYMQAAEESGATVGVIDTFSHEWSGIGGCCEIADKNKLGKMPNWAKAKVAHKKLVYKLLTSPIHWILCIRAQDKVKIFKKGQRVVTSVGTVESDYTLADDDMVVPVGLSELTEKSFVFELTVRIMLDERSHHAVPMKVPEPLVPLFPGGRLLTRDDGDRIRQWNETGSVMDMRERLQQRARLAAEEGTSEYEVFYKSLTAPQKKIIFDSSHAENKEIAIKADKDRAIANQPEFDRLPDPVEQVAGTTARYAGELWIVVDTEDEGHQWKKHNTAA
jgi:hypothetical protein